MPYNSNSDLPDSVKGVLPDHAQTIFRSAFNAAFKEYDGDEERCMKVAWAAVKSKYKKGEGDKWVSKENLRDWRRIEYVTNIDVVENSNISEKTDSKLDSSLYIEGVAINETITRNNVKYVAEELEKASPSLINKPILKDHRNEVDAIVGRTTESVFDKSAKALKFRGKIMDEKTKDMIKDGRITNVSIGARVKDLISEESEGSNVLKAEGIEFLELSLTPVPGDAAATLTQALSESYKIKEEQMIKSNIDEEDVDTDDLPEDTEEKLKDVKTAKKKQETAKADLKKNDLDTSEVIKMDEKIVEEYKTKLDEKDAAIKQLNEKLELIEKAKFDSLIAEYSSLAKEKNVTATDVSKLSKETVSALIETLKSIKVAEVKAETKGEVKIETKAEEKNDLLVERMVGGKIMFYRTPDSKGSYLNL